MSETRDSKGLFKKGVSGNPSGRPKGAKGLAKYVRKMIGADGNKLVDAMVTIVEGKSKFGTTNRDVISAVQWLADRGFGKPEERIILGGGADKGLDMMSADALSQLDDKELLALETLMKKMRRGQIDPDDPAFEEENPFH
jgi:hypothetical protein